MSRKILIIESEKSPNIQMRNKLDDVILERDRRRLGRSERSVVHRITVEQKILHRRFLQKKKRGQIRYAKIKGDQALEREVRGEHVVALNTDVASRLGGTNQSGDDDNEVLERIWATGRLKITQLLGKPKDEEDGGTTSGASRSSSNISRAQSSPDSLESRNKDRPRCFSAGARINPETLSSGSLPRPATTTAATTRQRKKNKCSPNSAGKSKMNGRRIAYVTAIKEDSEDDDDLSEEEFDSEQEGKCKNKPNIKTLKSVHIEDCCDDVKHTSVADKSKKTITPRDVKSAKSRPTTAASAVLPEEIIRLKSQLKQQMQKQLKITSYENDARVKEFVKTLRPFSAGGGTNDYYATKLRQATQNRFVPEWRIPGTPEEDIQRRIGHTNVRSLTQKTVDMNFQKRPSTFIDLSVL